MFAVDLPVALELRFSPSRLFRNDSPLESEVAPGNGPDLGFGGAVAPTIRGSAWFSGPAELAAVPSTKTSYQRAKRTIRKTAWRRGPSWTFEDYFRSRAGSTLG